MKGSLTSPINKSTTHASQARSQAQVEENKMSELEVWLNKIQKANLDEYS